MTRLPLLFLIVLTSCATPRRSSAACWWQSARFDSPVPLFDTETELELGTLTDTPDAGPRFEGTLRSEGARVLLEGTLEGNGLRLAVSADATKNAVLHVADRMRVGTAGMLLEGAPVLGLGLERGHVLIGLIPGSTSQFVPRLPTASVVACEALTLTAGKFTGPAVTRAGFSNAESHEVGETTVHDTPGGAVNGHFQGGPVSVVEVKDGWTRIVDEHVGLVWVGWVPSNTVHEQNTRSEGSGEPEAAAPRPSPEGSAVTMLCTRDVPLMLDAHRGPRVVGTVAPGTPVVVGASRNGKTLVTPQVPWFTPRPQRHFFTDVDVRSNCSEVVSP